MPERVADERAELRLHLLDGRLVAPPRLREPELH
jgi:hypothetical protein